MASMTLTERQRSELNVAIYEYMMSQGEKYSNTIENFRKEASIPIDTEIGKSILEKKWTSVVRLQKRLMELESKLEVLQQQRKYGVDGLNDITTPCEELKLDSKMLPRAPPRFRLTGHRASITAIAIHPTYTMVASGSEDTSIKLWDFESGQHERTLKGHSGSVTGLAFDRRGIYLGSCSSDISAKLWDLNTFTCIRTFKGHEHTLSQLKFVDWNNEDHIVTCSRDQTLKLWNINSGFCVRTLIGHSDWVKTIAVSLDSKYIASGGHDQTILVWSISTGDIIQTLRGHDHVIETLCYGKKPLDLSNSSGTQESAEKQSMEFSYLVSGGRDRTIRIWDSLSGICMLVLSSHENWVRCVFFHPSNKYVISCGDDKTIRVFDLKEGRCLKTISDAHSHFVSCIAMSSSYPVIVSGSVDKNISIWTCN